MASIWLVDRNPLALPAPPAWWQKAVYDYDSMLRVMPSQTERRYRLCRLIRRDSRLGARLASARQAAELQSHPDTRAMMRYSVVPELTLTPQAITSPLIVGLLQSRDKWRHWGQNPDGLVKAIEQAEADQAARDQAVIDAQLDAVNTDSFRHVKYGYRDLVQADRIFGEDLARLRPLPVLPDALPRTLTRSDL